MLDILFITETWLNLGDQMSLGDLTPPSCDILNSPRTSGHGRGVATLFLDCFKCRLLSTEMYSSFEVQLLKIDSLDPFFCALSFLSGLVSRRDKILVIGDFNMHLCSPSKPLVNEFLSLIESFKCQTLDLVLSFGFSVSNLEVSDVGISDHYSVVFDAVCSFCSPNLFSAFILC